MGVNDLVEEWRRHAFDNQSGFLYGAASDLKYIAKSAWHPVSQPPTGGDEPFLVIDHHGNFSTNFRAVDFRNKNYGAFGPQKWARIRDVVLLPPKEDK